ncbi:MAG TPA: hypothetical protein DD827_02360 [Gammaproteobacteria bacterium]|nr:hypothetical protein [Gammaproteobacteria bacterium]
MKRYHFNGAEIARGSLIFKRFGIYAGLRNSAFARNSDKKIGISEMPRMSGGLGKLEMPVYLKI